MPAKGTFAPQEVYQLKVTLIGTNPPIWRRLVVPAGFTLEQLHYVLQIAMGWENCHLHEFCIGRRRIGMVDTGEDLMGMPDLEDESAAPLSSAFGKAGAKAIYTYDFGDSWEHAIVLEKRLPADPKMSYPVCTGGERACPPEDCGGIMGFYDLLDAISDPRHEQHTELLEWLGDEFDPQTFSADDVNRRLKRLTRRRAKASKNRN